MKSTDLLRLILTRIALISAIAGLASPAAATDTLGKSPEIVVLGTGDLMDAVHLAIADEVRTINGDGGPQGKSIGLTHIKETCPADRSAALKRAAEIAQRRPLIVFAAPCGSINIEDAAVFSAEGSLYAAVGITPAALTEQRAGPTVFRLGVRDDRAPLELAFAISAEEPSNVAILHNAEANVASLAEQMEAELQRGFSATTLERQKWGEFLRDAKPEVTRHAYDSGAEESVALPESLTASLRNKKPQILVIFGRQQTDRSIVDQVAATGWAGKVYLAGDVTGESKPWDEGPNSGITILTMKQKSFFFGGRPSDRPPYQAFHPDWVAGLWQIMKNVKTAAAMDGQAVSAQLSGPPFFARAPWLMLQSRSRFTPLELRQRFNDNGDLRMAAFEFKQIWPQQKQ